VLLPSLPDSFVIRFLAPYARRARRLPSSLPSYADLYHRQALASVNALPDCAISATDMEAVPKGSKWRRGDILLIKHGGGRARVSCSARMFPKFADAGRLHSGSRDPGAAKVHGHRKKRGSFYFFYFVTFAEELGLGRAAVVARADDDGEFWIGCHCASI